MTAFLITTTVLFVLNVILSLTLMGCAMSDRKTGQFFTQLVSLVIHGALGAWSIYLLATK